MVKSKKDQLNQTRAPAQDEPVPAVGHVLRRAREYHGLSLRQVERITGRPNAYLSQVERGKIRRPDPLLLLELAGLYELNFSMLAEWLGMDRASSGRFTGDSDESIKALVSLATQLKPAQRAALLTFGEKLLRESRT